MVEFFNRGYSVKELNKRNKKRLLKISSVSNKGFTKKKNINTKKYRKNHYSTKEGLEQYRYEKEIQETQQRYCEHLKKMEEGNTIRRGDIVYCSLEEVGEGSEQAGKRPAIVVQNDTGNKYSSTTIVVFLTSKNKTKLPTHVDLVCGRDYRLTQRSCYSKNIALCEQVRTISKSRIIHKLGTVTPATMRKIDKALLISQGIDLDNLEKYKY